jgi:hypothetical protein
MSPEQWGEMPRDGNPEVDGRTDIYSLGMIFFELVAGQKPLGGRTLAELRQKHVSVPMPSLGSIAPDVPEEFGGWVARAMAKDRADRPQTAGELIDGLRSSLGQTERGRSTGVRFEGAGVDADGRGYGAGHFATGRVSPETNAGTTAQPNADTILTSDFDSNIPATDRGRETSAHQRGVTSGNAVARHDASRETIVDRVAGTQADASAVAPHTSAHNASAHASSHGAGVAASSVPLVEPGTRRSMMPLILGGVLALLLLAGVGWFVLSGSKSNVNAVGPGVPKPTATGASNVSAPNAPPNAPKIEAAGYWFETFEKAGAVNDAGQRVAEPAPTLTSGQSFRFHFMPKERGFLYIIGSASGGNAQAIVMTGQGVRSLKTNLVVADADFALPPSGEPWKLDPQPGADVLTIIFSPKPLDSPAFFAGKPKTLNSQEISALEEFRAQFKSDAPTIAAGGDGAEKRVVVNIPATAQGRPLIFDVRIDHK